MQSSTTRKLAGKQPATRGMTYKLAAATYTYTSQVEAAWHCHASMRHAWQALQEMLTVQRYWWKKLQVMTRQGHAVVSVSSSTWDWSQHDLAIMLMVVLP